jgi:hypothetical protein
MGYVDSFNLYFGLRSKGWSRLFWLDVTRLVTSLTKPGQVVAEVRYFTARLSGPGERQRQQKALLEAYDSLGKVRELFPSKRILVAFPPGRFSQSLAQAAHGYFVIGRAKLAASQLPDRIEKEDGMILERPASWA